LTGFEDFLQKIEQMGLTHLIVQKKYHKQKSASESKTEKKDSTNWWFLD
jgi:hypothetical protein